MIKDLIKKILNWLGFCVQKLSPVEIKLHHAKLVKNSNVNDLACIDIYDDQKYFYFRKSSVGDRGVIKQIFIDLDYSLAFCPQGKCLLDFYRDRGAVEKLLIIDGGANIGASAIYFKRQYPLATVFSIEPNKGNYELLRLNISGYSDCTSSLAGLSNSEDYLILEDPGHSDWGFRTRVVNGDSIPEGAIPAISSKSIMDKIAVNGYTPFILKIDIEGAESDFFSNDCSLLQLFPLIVIELHDWMLPFSGSSHNFLKSLAAGGFDFVHKGENIFLFNHAFLSSYFKRSI